MKGLKLKPTVKINGRHFDHEIRLMIDVARETAPDLSDDHVWITSGNDSTHMKGSKHYTNEAFDVRTLNLIDGRDAAKLWTTRIREALGLKYQVVLEKDHIHVEYDPK